MKVAIARRALLIGGSLLVSFVAHAEEPPKSVVVLGHFATTYQTDAEHKGRAFNVELAAEAINGKTIAAGAVFSFNDAVGERTAAFGYEKATVVRDGMLAEGTGGGACQVASTLHAAALLAGLDVVLRAPHSRPSAYIRLGLDATVAFGGMAQPIDLKLRNTFAHAVVVRAKASKGTLDVSFDSAAAKPEVTLTTEIIEWLPPAQRIERDPKRTDDQTVLVKSFGIPGHRVKRTRTIKRADGTTQRDVRFDLYVAVDEVLVVSTGFDQEKLAEPGVVKTPAAGAIKPLLVQLRPSTTVTLDNNS
jgi:vancomycin resistance protein YoaR